MERTESDNDSVLSLRGVKNGQGRLYPENADGILNLHISEVVTSVSKFSILDLIYHHLCCLISLATLITLNASSLVFMIIHT